MEADPKATDFAQVDGKEVEEEGPLGFCCKRNQFTLVLRAGYVIDVFQVGRFPTKSRSIIDDLAVNLSGNVINECQC